MIILFQSNRLLLNLIQLNYALCYFNHLKLISNIIKLFKCSISKKVVSSLFTKKRIFIEDALIAINDNNLRMRDSKLVLLFLSIYLPKKVSI